ncbi:AzlC family ABC transporter permease [Halobaculum sp. CBA1158]|uniref:AzlC family ABC transporter permease n=1 Tax=Halobaculum sp. CBA1158 TaxID=2904243 RepID=UPI001F20D6CD|nr:AzlC family ABC transporter permease [Halobaculum sp. CBA1158]UIO99519.1 AzlC family ABC transporter permease [Halobaculum sp. CBA1158]
MDSRLPPDVRDGVRDALPLLLGIVPFALVAGVAGVEAGLTPLQTVGLSVIVFAGASQLAAIELLGSDAALGVVVLTVVVINLRMLMYSASIAPYFRDLSARVRAGCAYLLTDQAYALALARYVGELDGDGTADRDGDRTVDRDSDADGSTGEARTRRPYYYLGVALTLWVVWQAGTVVGVVFGAAVPDGWRLGFAVPLVFLALLVPAVSDAPSLAAAVAAAAVAVGGAGLPFNAGLIAGGVVGVLVGVGAEAVGLGDDVGDGGNGNDGDGDIGDDGHIGDGNGGDRDGGEDGDRDGGDR